MKRKTISFLLSFVLIVTSMTFAVPVFGGLAMEEPQAVTENVNGPDGFRMQDEALLVEDVKDGDGTHENQLLMASEGVKWSKSGTTLTISGSGAMKDYSYGEAPWYQHHDVIERIVIKKGVTQIGKYAFYNFYNVSEISVAATVKTIGVGAFYQCSCLENVTLPNSVKTLKSGAFAECNDLKTFTANGLTKVEDYAFQSTSIETFCVGKGMKSLSALAFFSTAVKQFEIAEGNTSYREKEGVLYTNQGKTLFVYPSGSDNKSFTVPKAVTKIGDCAFMGSQNLETVELPKGLKTIGYSAFSRCESLQEISLPDAVKSIGDFAFSNCTSLEKIVFGDGIKKGSYRMMENCYSLETVDFGGLQTLDAQTFVYCQSLKKVVLPKTIKEIGVGNFAECKKLASFTSKGLDCIPYQTFFNCKKLTTVTLNNGIKDIYDQAFYGCKALKKLTVPKSTSHVYSGAVPKTTKIICKNPKLTAYGDNGRWYLEKATVKMTRKYDFAFQVLTLVNKERKKLGMKPLKMNQSLLKSAMIRSGEITVLYSHTRPDGREPFTINKLMMAENIAMGQTTPKEVMQSWMDSPGHKANILNSNARIIGIGCVKHNGTYYWAQCFGSEKQRKSCAKQKNKTVYQTIPFITKKFEINEGGICKIKLKISAGKSKLTKGKTRTAKIQVINPTTYWSETIMTGKGVKWSSSNKKVATVSSKGKIKALKTGKVTITAKTKQFTLKKTFTVTK